jgi:hypothetical protein
MAAAALAQPPPCGNGLIPIPCSRTVAAMKPDTARRSLHLGVSPGVCAKAADVGSCGVKLELEMLRGRWASEQLELTRACR